jgi:hypothetical protein
MQSTRRLVSIMTIFAGVCNESPHIITQAKLDSVDRPQYTHRLSNFGSAAEYLEPNSNAGTREEDTETDL